MSDERDEAEPIELGYIEDLGDMISVQEGATVSRTVMQKAGGNVVLFSLRHGRGARRAYGRDAGVRADAEGTA